MSLEKRSSLSRSFASWFTLPDEQNPHASCWVEMLRHRQHRIEVVLRREGPDERDDPVVAQIMPAPEFGDVEARPKALEVNSVVNNADLVLIATNVRRDCLRPAWTHGDDPLRPAIGEFDHPARDLIEGMGVGDRADREQNDPARGPTR